MSNAAIIQVGPLYFIMSALPASHNQVMTLILPEAQRPSHGILPKTSRGEVDILYFDDRSYFALLIQAEFDVAGEARRRFVKDVLQHAWCGLVGFGLVSGDMPEPVEGDPRKMM